MTTLRDRYEVYVGGRWIAPHGRERIDVENPATEEVLASVPECDADDVASAVRAARDAQPVWASSTPVERAAVLRALAQGLRDVSTEMAATITAEVGTPRHVAERIQAALPSTVLDTYADLVEGFTWEERLANTLVVSEPVGVVAAITPWNYPLHQIVAKVAPALAAGCTLIVKPSELSPLSAYLLFDVLHTLNLPPGTVNLVTGHGPGVGEALAAHPDVDAVSFTGSVATGQRVDEVAAATTKRVVLELGGKSANLVLADADLETAVKVGISNAFLNAGQTCGAWTRMLVPADQQNRILDQAATAAAGFIPADPTLPTTRLGPVVSAAAASRVRGYVEKGLADGARLVAGGPGPVEGEARGHFVQPTVFGDVDPDSVIAQEEIFGPVLCVIPYRDEDHAVEIANNSMYGLHGGVWSGDVDRAVAVARRLQTGTVDVNGAAYNPLAPFAGRKRSGTGAEMGLAGLQEMLQPKSIGLPA